MWYIYVTEYYPAIKNVIVSFATTGMDLEIILLNEVSRKIKGRRRWHPTPVLLPGKSHGRRSLQSRGLLGGWVRLSDFTFTFHFHAFEKEMATHSSVLAWRTPGIREPGGLLSMGSHRVGHD